MGYDTNSVLQAVDRKGVVAENPSVGKTYEFRRETLRRPTLYPSHRGSAAKSKKRSVLGGTLGVAARSAFSHQSAPKGRFRVNATASLAAGCLVG